MIKRTLVSVPAELQSEWFWKQDQLTFIWIPLLLSGKKRESWRYSVSASFLLLHDANTHVCLMWPVGIACHWIGHSSISFALFPATVPGFSFQPVSPVHVWDRWQELCGGISSPRALSIWTRCFSSWGRSSIRLPSCTCTTTAPCSRCGGSASNGWLEGSVSSSWKQIHDIWANYYLHCTLTSNAVRLISILFHFHGMIKLNPLQCSL